MDPDAVAKAFVEHYYTTFDTNRAGLANLYQDTSMLSFEGQKFQGTQSITAKLTSLPFQQCKHGITTVDCQPSGPAGGMLVFVSGNLQLAGEQHALKELDGSVSNMFVEIGKRNESGLDDLFLVVDGSMRFIFKVQEYVFLMFHLMPTPQGSFYVLNDIFRLNYA
ncbi:UNVERIFIED_CONTAM: Nuclear transport factor 2B [Sesamum indicum]